MKRELTCIGCPMGCLITAECRDGEIVGIEGYSCRVGLRYAQEELTAPKRTVTALCPVAGSHVPLAVKTSRPIDKRLIFPCLSEIAAHTAILPVHIGQAVLRGVCGTDVDIVSAQERME